MKYTYDIRQFKWNATENSFFGAAPFLECLMPDGNIHHDAFPNNKGEFFIHNYKTDGFRRFRYIKDITGDVDDIHFVEWLFQSEDGIQCRIGIEP